VQQGLPKIIDYEFGISAIDSGYQRPQLAAIHLIVEGDRAAVIDSGVNSSVPRVLEALAVKGMAPAQVDYLILTHVHLDHAGGAGALLSQLPNAALTVHPRGARHMIDPTRLVEGTMKVYGADATRRLYGDIVPVAASRIIETPDGTALRLNGRELSFFETPGHARHHVCVLDSKSGHVFAGDTFGLSYRELDRAGRPFSFPTTSPIDFDPPALHRSLDLIVRLRPPAVYVTHYGQVRDVMRIANDLHRLIDAHAELAQRLRSAHERYSQLKQGLQQLLLAELQHQRCDMATERVLDLFAGDIELNAQGLEAWLTAAPRGG
jgi:glyoxylase-like metal-dependent hydrolase (beta-lactamase superfamily II)